MPNTILYVYSQEVLPQMVQLQLEILPSLTSKEIQVTPTVQLEVIIQTFPNKPEPCFHFGARDHLAYVQEDLIAYSTHYKGSVSNGKSSSVAPDVLILDNAFNFFTNPKR